ncbi:hypothetical protein GGI21_002520 [Coemansia aciculifera]|nr:hypothetical protein GGI21_002520 [Coemansia aciculifera]
MAEVEDTSDEHYRKLHRKPEYMERRVRNREIELYQYAQWQEGQRMGSERWRQPGSGNHHHLPLHQQLRHDGGSEAGGSDVTGATQPQSRCASPLTPSFCKPCVKGDEADLGDGTALINETLRRLDVMQTSDSSATARKRFKSGMRNELKALLDSTGYQDARARSTANNNNGNADDNDVSNGNGDGGNDVTLVVSVSTATNNTPVVGTDVVATGGESVALQQPLTEAERKAAHLSGTILEQLLIQAARLPPLGDEHSSDEDEGEEAKEEEEDEEKASDEAEEDSDSSGEDQSVGSVSDDEQENDATDNDDSASLEGGDVSDSCCCPREFELPQRLFGHMTKQRS